MAKIPVQIIDAYFDTETPREDIFEPVSDENLTKGLIENVEGCKSTFDNNYAFAFLKLVSEYPEKAGKILSGIIKNTPKDKEMKKLFKNVKKGNLLYDKIYEGTLRDTYKSFGTDFTNENLIYLFGMIKESPSRFLNESEKIYDEIYSKEKTFTNFLPEIKTISNALNNNDFSDGGHYYVDEEIEIPDDVKMRENTSLKAVETALYFASKSGVKPKYFEEIRWTGQGMEKVHYRISGFLIEDKNEKILVEFRGAYSDDPKDGEVRAIYKTSKDTPDERFIRKAWGRPWEKEFKELSVYETFGGRKQAEYDVLHKGDAQIPYDEEHLEQPGVAEVWEDRIDIKPASQ